MFKHCKDEKLSYLTHMRHALRYFYIVQKAAFCLLIHSFLPCFFEKTASRSITNLAIHFHLKSKRKSYKSNKNNVR